jgi:hypothetical protein
MPDHRDHLIAACRRIEDDCTYTGQTHFEMAAMKSRSAKGWLVFLPSMVSASSGLAVALGVAGWVGAFAALAGTISAVATFLGVDKEATAHEMAGKLLTQLKHEARALREADAPDLSVESLAAQVRVLTNRYGAFVASLPVTDNKAFQRVRARLKARALPEDSLSIPTVREGPKPAALPAPEGDSGSG